MKIYHPNNPDKTIGYVKENEKVFITYRNPKHYFYKYKGFGLSNSVITQLEELGVLEVVVIFESKTKKTTYKTKLRAWKKLGKNFEYKGDKQKILPTKEMEKIGEKYYDADGTASKHEKAQKNLTDF